ncbi:GSCOCG00006367001-RA-CDS [Cotesia congregata]|nr:GSCOCG00006367001-RA-CDS [Cotesia congregata]
MDWIITLSCIILMDNRRMRGYLFASSPPADNVFLSIYTMIQIIKIHRVAQFCLYLIIGFLVRDTEAIRYFNHSFFDGTK